MPYTKEQRENGLYGLCPLCGSREVQIIDEIPGSDYELYENAYCGDCNHEWTRKLMIVDVTNECA